MGLKINIGDESIIAEGTAADIDITITPQGNGNIILDGQSFPNAIGSASDVLTVSGGVLAWVAPSGSNLDSYLYTDTPVTAPAGTGAGTLVIGDGATGDAFDDGVVIGNGADIDGNSGVAIGQTANAGTNAVAVGIGANSAGPDSVAVGRIASAIGTESVVIGNNASNAAGTSNSIVIGRNASVSVASGVGSIAIGADVNNTVVGEVQIGTTNTHKFRLKPDGTLSVEDTLNYETLVTADDDIPNKKYVDDITKVYRVGHTYAISGAIAVPSGDTDFILPFFVSFATGQTASIVKARHSINGGASATVKLQRNGVDITGYTAITVNTTPSDTTQTQALTDNDELALVVTAVSGAPMNMNFTIFIEYTQ